MIQESDTVRQVYRCESGEWMRLTQIMRMGGFFTVARERISTCMQDSLDRSRIAIEEYDNWRNW